MVKELAKRHWLNIITLILIVLVVFFARNDLLNAWGMLGKVNIWIFLLIIPLQFLSYYASGAMSFSYLKSQGDLKDVSPFEQPKMALELNFVNHIFPSGGVSGISYMTYRMGKLGVSPGRATLSQVVRLLMQFISFSALLVLAVLSVTLDGSLTRFTILVASSLVSVIIGGFIGVLYLLGNVQRLEKFEGFLDTLFNKQLMKLLRRKKPLVEREKIQTFFADLHQDYLTLRREPRYLVRPFWWGIVFNLAETAMYFFTFLSLGTFVNPAPILIALGLAGLIGTFLVTPGGAGGYEASMILFLTSAGVNPAILVAGILLARTTLIVMTIASGYLFYNAAMKKYGKHAA